MGYEHPERGYLIPSTKCRSGNSIPKIPGVGWLITRHVTNVSVGFTNQYGDFIKLKALDNHQRRDKIAEYVKSPHWVGGHDGYLNLDTLYLEQQNKEDKKIYDNQVKVMMKCERLSDFQKESALKLLKDGITISYTNDLGNRQIIRPLKGLENED